MLFWLEEAGWEPCKATTFKDHEEESVNLLVVAGPRLEEHFLTGPRRRWLQR